MDGIGDTPRLDLGVSEDGAGPVLAFGEGDGAAAIAPDARFTASEGWSARTWTLAVTFGETGAPDDLLKVAAKGGITPEAGEIRFGTVVIGIYEGGERGLPLAVVFNEAATAEAVQALLRAIAFANASED